MCEHARTVQTTSDVVCLDCGVVVNDLVFEETGTCFSAGLVINPTRRQDQLFRAALRRVCLRLKVSDVPRTSRPGCRKGLPRETVAAALLYIRVFPNLPEVIVRRVEQISRSRWLLALKHLGYERVEPPGTIAWYMCDRVGLCRPVAAQLEDIIHDPRLQNHAPERIALSALAPHVSVEDLASAAFATSAYVRSAIKSVRIPRYVDVLELRLRSVRHQMALD